jgi:hypothetical protein
MNPYITKQARAQAVVEDLTLTNLVEKALIQYLPKETVVRKIEIVKLINNKGGEKYDNNSK